MINLKLFGKLALTSFLAVQAIAQEETPKPTKAAIEQAVDEGRFLILGQIIPENGTVLTGSSARLGVEDIRSQSYADVNRVLRKIPGINIREEDGYGIFNNISMRGVDSSRSAKITLMEDGIMSAPAPYSNVAAYYSPNVARMSGLEVIKGSSSLKYGPHSVGGVINYLSTPIPQEETFYFKQLFGNFGEARTHAYYGNSFDLEAGRLSFLFEYYDRQNDGFKDIQHSSQTSGIEKQQEPMLKLRFEPKSDLYQFFEFKIGHSEFAANESYVGIDQSEFGSNPYDRYWGTQWDNIASRQTRTYFKHYIELDEETSLETTAYFNRFHRNWEKTSNKTSDVIDDGSGDSVLDILKGNGSGADQIRLKNNNRDYDSYGIQTELKKSVELGGLVNNFTLGARYHIDDYDDHSWYKTYNVDGRDVTGVSSTKGTATEGDYFKTKALSLYLVDEIEVTDKLTLAPGVRYETIKYRFDERNGGLDDTNQHSFWAPGIGFAYDFTESLQLFGGIHKGISTPGVEANVVNGTRHEESLSYELGLRYSEGAFAGEAVLFFNDISNYYDGASQASGQSKGQTVGDVETYGLELSAAYDLGVVNNWDFENPWYASFTYTQTEITELDETIPNGFFKNAEVGNEMPYIPEYQFAIGTGFHWDKVGFDISTSFVGDMYASAENDREVGSHFIVDLSAYYDVTENIRLLANVHNLLDEEYETSYNPYYDRPGIPLTFTAGFEVRF